MTRTLSDILPTREAVDGIGDIYQTYGEATALWFLEEFVGGMFVSCERCLECQVGLEGDIGPAENAGLTPRPVVEGGQGRLF